MPTVLQGCPHANVGMRDERHGTCLNCYRRVRLDLDTPGVTVDTAPGPCDHAILIPVSQVLNRNKPYQDALCRGCGRVRRHPDAPGQWVDVLDYDFRIRETP